MSKAVFVSLCLLGAKCRYDGRILKDKELISHFVVSRNILAVCPEVLAGLGVPRSPVEIMGLAREFFKGQARIVSREGKDFTSQIKKTCYLILKMAKSWNIKEAILKEYSPLCGVEEVYDGTFKNRLKRGEGLLTFLFRESGIKVYSDLSFRNRGRRI